MNWSLTARVNNNRKASKLIRRKLGLVLALGLVFSLLSGCKYKMLPIGENGGGRVGSTLVYAYSSDKGAPNAGIILTSQGAVVVDPPLNTKIGFQLHLDAARGSGEFWLNKHKLMKRNPKTSAPPVLYVFNTTFRGSHVFGNRTFKRQTDIYSTAKARKRLVADGAKMKEVLRAKPFAVPGLENLEVVPATHTIDDGDKLTMHTEEVEFQFISVGDCVGEGDAVLWLPGQSVLFTGDLVHVGYVSFYRGRTKSVRNWIAKLKELEKLEPKHVVPGHGFVGTADLLVQQREYLEYLYNAVKQERDAGKSKDDAAKSIALPSKYTRWMYQSWLPHNVKLIYEELDEAGKSAMVPAPGEKGLAVRPKTSSGNQKNPTASVVVPPMEKPDPYQQNY